MYINYTVVYILYAVTHNSSSLKVKRGQKEKKGGHGWTQLDTHGLRMLL